MRTTDIGPLEYRPMTLEDLDRVPLRCQGSRAEIAENIARIGSSAILAFEGQRHVAQVQFRPYDRLRRSTNGIWDPRYWGDFGPAAPVLPPGSISIFCFHVGQLEDSDARDTRYEGHGIGVALLDALIAWADAQACPAIIAKCTPAAYPVMAFMGGQPASRYLERGFRLHSHWVDAELREAIVERGLIDAGQAPEPAATVGCCVRVR